MQCFPPAPPPAEVDKECQGTRIVGTIINMFNCLSNKYNLTGKVDWFILH